MITEVALALHHVDWKKTLGLLDGKAKNVLLQETIKQLHELAQAHDPGGEVGRYMKAGFAEVLL